MMERILSVESIESGESTNGVGLCDVVSGKLTAIPFSRSGTPIGPATRPVRTDSGRQAIYGDDGMTSILHRAVVIAPRPGRSFRLIVSL